jgi:uncharacterized protein (DUF2336 family)
MPYITDATKRYVSAALSNSKHAPNALVRRLCEESPEICAPLLLTSPALTPLDLVVIVGTKTSEHARIISKRSHLPNPVIEALALLDDPIAKARVTYGHVDRVSDLPQAQTSNLKPVSAEEARQRLREIMATSAPVSTIDAPIAPTNQQNLLRLALHEQEAVFATALADTTGLPLPKILKLTQSPTPSELSTVLKAIGVQASDAFIMCAVFFPVIATNRSEIKLFLERHTAMESEDANEMVRGWKADEIRAVMTKKAANTSEEVHDLSAPEINEIDWAELLIKAS